MEWHEPCILCCDPRYPAALGLGVSDSNWIDATPLPGTFVVNLGDVIARWTENEFRSTVHQVINLSGADRYEVPFFFNGNIDYLMAPLPGWSRPESANGSFFTVEQHLVEMYRHTYASSP
jgi:isopenicillin N synthase-like dioxygenase